jgi:hypothetical protein
MAGENAPQGGNAAEAAAASKAATAGDVRSQSTGLAPAPAEKAKLAQAAIDGIEEWFQAHLKGSNELSQDTQLHNMVHTLKEQIKSLLGERA